MKSYGLIPMLLALIVLAGCFGGYPVQQSGVLKSCPTGAEVFLFEGENEKGSKIGSTPLPVSLTSEWANHWRLKAVIPSFDPQQWSVHGGKNIDHYFDFSRPLETITPLSQQVSTYVTEEKNYVLGTTMSTPVGGEMIRFKKYHTRETEIATPNKSFELGNITGAAYVVAGKPYKVMGKVNLDGEQLYLVEVETKYYAKQPPAAVVKKNGVILSKVVFAPYERLYAGGCSVSLPSDALFEMKPIKDFSAFSGDGNYQILYSGTSGEQIRLAYREFTSDDMARVAYYQELTYNKNNKKIRFRNIQIEVQDATNETISFAVVAD